MSTGECLKGLLTFLVRLAAWLIAGATIIMGSEIKATFSTKQILKQHEHISFNHFP